MSDSSRTSTSFVIRGRDLLREHPGFELIGRDSELADISNVLLRMNTDNLILTGPQGVGITSLCLGLSASKDKLDTPFDIVNKRFFWLDTDALFASGDMKQINEGFSRALQTVTRAPSSVLVIDDMRDFIDGATAHGVRNIVNALMRAARHSRQLQLIVECRDSDLPEVLKCHSHMLEFFVIKEVREPKPEYLDAILGGICRTLERHHGVPACASARAAAIELTSRYHVKELDRAQPMRSKMLIESAITNYRRMVHSRPAGLPELDRRIDDLTKRLSAVAVGDASSERTGLEAELQQLRAERERVLKEWESFQLELRQVYQDQRAAETKVIELETEIDAERERIAAEARRRTEAAEAKALPGEPTEDRGRSRFRSRLAGSGLDSETIAELESKKAQWQAALDENRTRYESMTVKLNENLLLTADHVYDEFSKLSGIDVRRLKEDEATKLLELEATLESRVFGQPEPVAEVAKSVRRGRTGLKRKNKPIGSFIFLGPTGVGKTELAKALAAALFGDDSMLRVYDMSEYQEKHAVSALIGAPPGYEGYEYGGVLTNNMRKHPRCVNVFDEIEKAHKDIFDLFLQIVDEGRLTDRRGLVASFADSVNILTSNIGQPYFLDESLSFEEAKERALADLWDPKQGGYRPEFLARFTGIFCFNRLGLSTIETIAERGLSLLNEWIEQPGLRVDMSREDLAAMCRDQYDPTRGARSILIGWVENKIASEVAEVILRNSAQRGLIRVSYDAGMQQIRTALEPEAATETAPAV